MATGLDTIHGGQGELAMNRYVTGTIAAQGDYVAIDALDMAGGVFSVSGTFSGELEALGGLVVGETSNLYPRMLFKSGIGSAGTNIISNTGGALNREFMFVGGGARFMVRAKSWVSGSVIVSIRPQSNHNVSFLNGPAHTAEEDALRSGRAFVGSTAVQSVTTGNAMFVTIANPTNSGTNAFLTNRLFNTNSTDKLEFQAYANPTAALTQTANIANRQVGGAASVMTMKYQIAPIASVTMGGTAASGDFIPIERRLLATVIPGQVLGFVITGAGTNLNNTARIVATFDWFEEAVN